MSVDEGNCMVWVELRDKGVCKKGCGASEVAMLVT